jgi:hypothetical protein
MTVLRAREVGHFERIGARCSMAFRRGEDFSPPSRCPYEIEKLLLCDAKVAASFFI